MKARVHITLKPGVFDPQGKAIEDALHGMGFDGVDGVRAGKLIELDVTAPDADTAEKQVRSMCDKLLSNPVMESYRIEMIAT